MKKLNKLQINSEKLMNNEELISLKGGYGSIACYAFGGFGGCGGGLVTYMNTPCLSALELCIALGGGCIEGCGV